jgi:dTMP kinase
MIKLLRRGHFRDLLVGQAASGLGDWIGTIALMALALRLSGSPAAVGGILVIRLAPAALAGPVVARVAHVWDRRKTMLAMDVARAGIVAAVPLVRALWWEYLLAFALELGGVVFLAARDASIPDLVEPDDLPLANGLVLGSSYGGIPVGAALFAAITAVTGGAGGPRPYAIAFWVDAATFLVSFAMVRRLAELGPAEREPVERADARPRFLAAFRIPIVSSVMPATIAVSLGIGSLFSLGIVFVRETLHASDTEFGFLIALFGAGAAAGIGVLVAARPKDGLGTTRIAVGAQGAMIAIMSLAGSVGMAYAGAVGFGAASAAGLASGMSYLQSRLTGEDRVLAFGVFHVVIRVGLSLAALGAGVAADVASAVRWPVVGRLGPVRLVLLCSGLMVLLSAAVIRPSLKTP